MPRNCHKSPSSESNSSDESYSSSVEDVKVFIKHKHAKKHSKKHDSDSEEKHHRKKMIVMNQNVTTKKNLPVKKVKNAKRNVIKKIHLVKKVKNVPMKKNFVLMMFINTINTDY